SVNWTSTSSNVIWELQPGSGCTGSATTIQCGAFTITAPPSPPAAPPDSVVQLTKPAGVGSAIEGYFGVKVAPVSVDPGDTSCTWQYMVHVTGDGGGWGDPHITTVDGVAYDFQSAGEFTALRQKELEIQTRQTAVPTAAIPNANPYTGLS